MSWGRMVRLPNGSKEARYVYPPVHLSRSIREEAQAREAFFAATVKQLTEGPDKWRRQAERRRD
jgi:hypothetical protein